MKGGLQPLHRVGHYFIPNSRIDIHITIQGKVGDECLGYATVETAHIETAGYGCLSSTTVGTANIGTAGNGCLHDANVAKDVYTSDGYLAASIGRCHSIIWKPSGNVYLISAEELARRMKE